MRTEYVDLPDRRLLDRVHRIEKGGRVVISFKAVNQAALPNLDRILRRWLPGGRRKGREYVALNPTRRDRHLGSFRINLETGRWADFATDDRGSDVISLVAYLDHLSQVEAARRLADELGIRLTKRSGLAVSTQQLAKDRARRQEEKMRAAFWRMGRLAALESAKEKAVETGDVPLLADAAAEAWKLQRATGSVLLDQWRTALVRDAENATAYEAKGREDTEQAACLTGIAVAIIAAAERHDRIFRSPVQIRRKAA